MALYKVNGHYITYVEGYIEAEDSGEARRKATHGRHWKTSPSEIPIHELAIDYIKEVDEIGLPTMLKTKVHPAFAKGSNEQ
tara:strand:+ start:3088 stop:3330 length:243 start_codon:yes stop_codon:yes gene_type:complete